ncbi:DUF6119 family protein [Rhizobium esperanzae]|uniref:Uncharacterized protein (TIGR04141 family) n=1 Tax=Rhizobium esperanzae TaxID=1967781 RepID=A0A7W6R578_9HYPH|nr:DUF6119 family protein [Rhizobium esperanzae]MBB4237018.1 uncharacterized protein (TIGR04141 family) [Rhizobium esperanzae]
MAEEDPVDIAQISFYLAKPQHTFETVLSAEKDVAAHKAAQQFNFDVEGVACRFYYFETVSKRSNPPWLEFLNDKIAAGERISFNARSESPNGILLMKIEERVFAATFGRSASSHLEEAAFEPDFGIKTAMNLCGNEEVRQTRSQSNTVTPTQIDRQVGKPSDTFTFGLSEAEDLRYISANIKGDKNLTLQGRNNLTVKVIGRNRLTWPLIVARCREFQEAFGKKDYASLFPNYKNFGQASPGEVAALDGELLKLLKAREFDRIQIGIPEFVAEESYSFTYSDHSKRENTIHSFLDPQQLDRHLKLDEVTIEQLKGKRIFAYSHEEDRILSYRRWRVYNCIVFEHRIGEKYFVLSDGRWLEVDCDFYASIVKFVAEVLHEEPCEDAYVDINISSEEDKKNKESLFNQEVCKRRPSAILFDRAKLRIGSGRADKEFCDILDLTDLGRIRIIHCKPYKDSSSTNYLFAQANLYSTAFLQDQIFLEEIRRHVGAAASPCKADYLTYIKEHIAELNAADYDICLWLLFDRLKPKPDKGDIPLMAMYELKLMHDHLRNILKFKDIIVRFVPVAKVQFTTSKKPTVKAA